MEDTSLESNEYQEIEEIPEFFQPGYVERVVDALPYYFPNYLKEKLKREHPDIPVSSKEIEQENSYFYYDPGRKYLYSGAHYLNEMLVESLTMSILTEVNDNTETGTYYMKYLFEPFLSDYGRNDTTMELIQHMQVAMLSGDFRQTNKFLRDKYSISIFDFLGDFNRKMKDKQYTYPQNEKEGSSVSGRFFCESLQIFISPSFQEELNSLEKKVLLFKKYLKLDRLFFDRKEIENDKNWIQELEEERIRKYLEIAGTGIHETLHYLSFNPTEERHGFKFDNQSNLYKLLKTY